jgi:NAD(P)H-flavin reductase
VPYRVVDKMEEVSGADDITSLHVVPVEGELPDFLPAQVSMLGAFGVGEAAISVSSAVDNRDYHAYTIRRAGPISGALVDTPVGGLITIRGPFGFPWPLNDVATSQLLIIGGGLGIAPLRAVIHHAVAQAHRFDRIVVVYGAKSPDVLVYRNDLARWAQQGIEVVLTVDVADETWDGPVGVVPHVLGDPVDMAWDEDVTAFVCGPDIMMHFTAQRLRELGMGSPHIWLTTERNMQCGNALCGHCQLGPFIVCRDGPVVNYEAIERFHPVKEL